MSGISGVNGYVETVPVSLLVLCVFSAKGSVALLPASCAFVQGPLETPISVLPASTERIMVYQESQRHEKMHFWIIANVPQMEAIINWALVSWEAVCWLVGRVNNVRSVVEASVSSATPRRSLAFHSCWALCISLLYWVPDRAGFMHKLSKLQIKASYYEESQNTKFHILQDN